MDYTLHRVPDPTSDGAAHPWLVGSLNVAALCEQELFGHTDFVPTLRRTLSDHRGSSSWVSTTWVAVTGEGADPEADDVLGYVRADLSLRENLTKAFMDGGVRPDLRRQGMATALLERATADLAADGRTTQVIYAVSPDATGHPDALPSPVGAGAVDGRMPNARLLLARGFTLEQYEHASTLTLTDAALEHALELAREAATHAAGYELVSWADRCPDDLIDGMADLHRHMSTDIPRQGWSSRRKCGTPRACGSPRIGSRRAGRAPSGPPRAISTPTNSSRSPESNGMRVGNKASSRVTPSCVPTTGAIASACS